MEFFCLPNPYILNIVGISLDMIGAVLVATEVVSKFKGEKYEKAVIDKPTLEEVDEKNGDVLTTDAFGERMSVVKARPTETVHFKHWQVGSYRKMAWGLFFLLLGFSIQILSNLIGLNC